MQSLQEFIIESNILHIFEGAVGINLSNNKNLDMFKKYLNHFFIQNNTIIKCIDGDKGFKEFDEDLQKFCKDENSEEDTIFYIKINANKTQICLYENTVANYDQKKLENLGIYKNENSTNRYKLILKTNDINWESPQIESTQKNPGKVDVKIWPEFEIIKTWQPKNALEDNYQYDFGSKKAYIIHKSEFNNFGKKMSNKIKSCEDIENNELISKLFETPNKIQDIVSSNKKVFRNENLLATIISEPLAILYSIIEEKNILQELLGNNNSEITNIIIPIAQNYKVADFLIEVDESIIIPISVKSGRPSAGGNRSSILSLMNSIIDKEYKWKDKIPEFKTNNIKNELSFLKEFINAFSYSEKKNLLVFNEKTLKLNDSIINLQEFVLDILEYYNTNIDNKKKFKNRNELLKGVYNQILEILVNKNNNILTSSEINNLKEIGKNGNLCEKFFATILNYKSDVNRRLAQTVGASANCFKLHINISDYSYQIIKQTNTAKSIDIKPASHLNKYTLKDINQHDGKLISFKVFELEGKVQGQPFGYILHN